MNKNRSISTLALMAILSTFAAGSAFACGEVMSRMGSALRYQSFVTRHPARILIYTSGNAADPSIAKASERLRASLEKAGHHVTLADSPAALARDLGARPYDIIITGGANVAAVATTLASASSRPALIPVLDPGQEAALKAAYPLAVNADANLNRYLKAIETSMRSRGS
ncbi:MAG: hypothetical protein U1F23_01405 [Lysobacterales bacterium]